MSRANPKNETLQILSTDDGLHLKDTILWLDAHKTGQLSFLSVAQEEMKTCLPQVITTEETIKILEAFHRKPNALVCQYNRPFSIGRLKMELLPSGHALGGASLYLETDATSVLYAPHIQIHRIATHRQYQLKKAKILILGAYAPDATVLTINRNKEREALSEWVKAKVRLQAWPMVLCQTFPLAQELTKLFSSQDIPVAVHQHIYKINKVYEDYGASLGSYSLYSPRRSKHKVALVPLASTSTRRLLATLDRPFAVVRHKYDGLPAYCHQGIIEADFSLYASSYGSDFQDIIEKVKPKEVYFFGPYAKANALSLAKAVNLPVRPLFARDQPSLF